MTASTLDIAGEPEVYDRATVRTDWLRDGPPAHLREQVAAAIEAAKQRQFEERKAALDRAVERLEEEGLDDIDFMTIIGADGETTAY